jgi:hypothetical protein
MLHAAAQPGRYGYYFINPVKGARYTVEACDSRAHIQDASDRVNAIDARDSGPGGAAPIRKVSKLRRVGVAVAFFCTTGHDSSGQGYLSGPRPY